MPASEPATTPSPAVDIPAPTAEDMARDLVREYREVEGGIAVLQKAGIDLPDEALAIVAALRRAIHAERELDALRFMLAGDGGKIVSLIEGRLSIRHWAVRVLAASLAQTFEEEGGTNYVATEVTVPNTKVGPLIVTIQRQAGKSPAELKTAADARAAAADARAAAADARAAAADARAAAAEAEVARLRRRAFLRLVARCDDYSTADTQAAVADALGMTVANLMEEIGR